MANKINQEIGRYFYETKGRTELNGSKNQSGENSFEVTTSASSDSVMPFATIINVEIEEDRMEEFKVTLSNNAINSRKEPGCLRFDVLQDKSEPTKFVFYEVYKDEAALNDHKNTEHYKKWADFKASGAIISQTAQKLDGLFYGE